MRFLIESSSSSSSSTKSTEDGLVFTSPTLPYKAGRDKSLFKWKEASKNTVDLLYSTTSGDGTLHVRNTTATATAADATTTMPLLAVGRLLCRSPDETYPENAILECLAAVEDCSLWMCVRHRTDRSEPNADWVYRRVLESLRENITLEELCNLPGVR